MSQAGATWPGFICGHWAPPCRDGVLGPWSPVAAMTLESLALAEGWVSGL